MNEPLIYIAQASLYGLTMWVIYCCALRGKPWHRASRLYLLMSAIIPLILPFVHLQVRSSATIYSNPSIPQAFPDISNSTVPHSVGSSLDILLSVYIVITVIIASFHVALWLRLFNTIRNGSRTRLTGYTIITNTRIGPGTVGTSIFFPSDEIDNAILSHELAHIHSGHRYDSLFIQLMHIFFWISPATWLIGHELKTVHEFEADATATKEIDPDDYTRLLLSQAFGISPIHIAHSFFHRPLKRRILMLQKVKQSRAAQRTFSLSFILTAVLFGGVLFAQTVEKQPAKAEKQSAVKETPKPKPAETKAEWINPNQLFYMPDGRRIYSSMKELHNWYPKDKSGKGC